MTITVKFRGPILFVHDGDGGMVEALIPNSETAGRHDDGDTAKAHLAGILVLSANGKLLRRLDLLDTTVTITEQGVATRARVGGTFGAKVPLGFMVNNGAPRGAEVSLDPSRGGVSSSIVIQGGSGIESDNLTAATFPIPEHLKAAITATQRLPLLTVWEAGGPVTIEIVHKNGDAEKPLTLQDGEQVYIYNWDHDEPEPTKARLECPMDEGNIVDLRPESDFKWLYKLLIPPAGTSWAQWIKADQHKSLPAPLSTLLKTPDELTMSFSMFFPPNSACDGAMWP